MEPLSSECKSDPESHLICPQVQTGVREAAERCIKMRSLQGQDILISTGSRLNLCAELRHKTAMAGLPASSRCRRRIVESATCHRPQQRMSAEAAFERDRERDSDSTASCAQQHRRLSLCGGTLSDSLGTGPLHVAWAFGRQIPSGRGAYGQCHIWSLWWLLACAVRRPLQATTAHQPQLAQAFISFHTTHCTAATGFVATHRVPAWIFLRLLCTLNTAMH